MTPVELMAIGVVGIYMIVAMLRKAFPQIPSRFVPLINLGLGIGLAAYIAVSNDLNIVEVVITALLPALGASGAHSSANAVAGN